MAEFEGTAAKLRQGFEVETGAQHRVKLLNHKLRVRLHINPNDAGSWDDKFILYAERDGERYQQTKTVKDDLVQGDDYIDLEYEYMMEDATYTLVIDPGKEGKPYNYFTDVPFADLFP